jgi:hypothetical protein
MTPTPPIQPLPSPGQGGWRFRSLPAFMRSLQTVAKLGATTCYPGHGDPFDSVADAIAANLSAIEERNGRVLEALTSGGPAPTYELGERLYPRALKRRFWQIIATLQGNLDILEDNTQVILENGRWRLR